MATSSPAQERQLVPMESMNRRLDSVFKEEEETGRNKRSTAAKKRQVAKLTLRTGET